jgi:hypothetical protein
MKIPKPLLDKSFGIKSNLVSKLHYVFCLNELNDVAFLAKINQEKEKDK